MEGFFFEHTESFAPTGSSIDQSDRWRCVTCDGGSHGHGHGHEAEQEADGLGHVVGADQLEGDGSHDADEAAVKQPHQQAHGDEAAKDVAQRDHHGHEADDEEGRHLEGRQGGATGTI